MSTRLALYSFVDIFHLGVFNSGAYLVVGATGAKAQTPFTAVFAADGRKVKEIYEPEDEDARQRAEGGDSSYTYPSGLTNKSAVLADATTGSDGNVYRLHGVSPLIYVISPTGDVVRKLHIDAGQLDGRPIANYEVSETASDSDPVLTCYNAAGVMLVPRGTDRSLRLIEAVLP